MDISTRRVLLALAPGPAMVRILVTSYGMGIEESEEALAAAVDEGICEQVGSMAFGLTQHGKELADAEFGGRIRPVTAEDLRRKGTREEMRQLHAEGDRHATPVEHKAGALMRQHANRTGGRAA